MVGNRMSEINSDYFGNMFRMECENGHVIHYLSPEILKQLKKDPQVANADPLDIWEEGYREGFFAARWGDVPKEQ